MKKVTLQYNNDKNTWRTIDALNFDTSEKEWAFVENCDEDAAVAFIEKMNEIQKTPPGLRFTDMNRVRLLLRDHIVSFLVDKKRKEYEEAGKKIIVLRR